MNNAITDQISVFVTMTPRPDKLHEVIGILQARFARIRAQERECLQLAAHVTGAGDVLLYELWSDRASFKTFVDGPDMATYLADLDTRLVSREVTEGFRLTA